MAEEGGTIIERIVRFVMGIEGAEKVTEDITRADRVSKEYIETLKELKATMDSLAMATREGIHVWANEYIPQIKGITQVTDQWATKLPAVAENLKRLSVEQFTATEAGQGLLRSFGFLPPVIEETETAAESLRRAFWGLNTTARALLRIFVAFKILTGIIGIFRDMAQASVDLQRELWSLRVIISSAGQEIEGGLGTWDDWLERIERLRQRLPLIDMTDLIRGAKTLIVTLDQLDFSAEQMELVIGLAGEMAILMGQEFPSYSQRLSTAIQGQTRNWAQLGVNLTESSKALMDYTEELGYNWDELNRQQRMMVRTLFLAKEFIRITEDSEDAIGEQWQALEALRAKRADLMAQQPNLIQFQTVWNQLLVLGTEAAAKAAEMITRFFVTIVSGIAALIVVVVEQVRALREGEIGWDAFRHGLERFGEVKDEIYQGVIEGTTILEWLDERLGGAGEAAEDAAKQFLTLEEAGKAWIDAAADAAEATDELTDRLNRAFQQAQSALDSWRRAQAQAWERLQRRLADIVETLERRLADLETRYEARRDELIRRFEERRADIRREAAEREEELREDLNKRLRRMEEDHLMEMQELREEYLLDLHEAARKRDAISMRRIQQRYILEKRQAGRDYEVRQRRAREDYEEQLRELREAREEQERELEESLDRQLRELEENYQRQQEEARLNAERQREDAQEDYRQRLQDLERTFQERLSTIISNLIYEGQEFEHAYGSLRSFFDLWYQGDLQTLADWLNERLQMMREAGLIEARAPIEVDWPPSGPRPGIPMAMGGFGLATGPTPIMVGEEGPEYFAAWRAETRLPREAIDIRLTIDGTQQGAWSADFETQVLRVFRGVLEEVGL